VNTGARETPETGVPFVEQVPWWIGLCLFAAFAWVVTIAQAHGMGVGPGTMGLTLWAFLIVWVVMMAAMMFPSVAPTATAWIRSMAARPTRAARVGGTVEFLSGYMVAWAAFGVLVYVLLLGAHRLVDVSPTAAKWTGAAIFAAAGIYQLTPLKTACLRHCRSPIGSLFHYASYKGPARDLRVGMHHGLYCIGCCWGLMIVLVAVGAMNIPAMVLLAGVIFIEKVWRHGAGFAVVVGIVLILMAVLAPFEPWLLPGLRATTMSPM
jgi:predicted metal-binding membrane protein